MKSRNSALSHTGVHGSVAGRDHPAMSSTFASKQNNLVPYRGMSLLSGGNIPRTDASRDAVNAADSHEYSHTRGSPVEPFDTRGVTHIAHACQNDVESGECSSEGRTDAEANSLDYERRVGCISPQKKDKKKRKLEKKKESERRIRTATIVSGPGTPGSLHMIARP